MLIYDWCTFQTFACKEKNKTYIVMEYCFGNVETLIQSTCNHRLTESDSHDLFTQLIDGYVPILFLYNV